jgi:hypothetical protein
MVVVEEVRTLSLSLPGVKEHDHWGKPSFRIRNKIFAVIQPDGVSLLLKTTKEERAACTTLAPDIFLMPDSFTNLAYMIVRLDRIDPSELRDLLVHAWKLVAPKKLLTEYEAATAT